MILFFAAGCEATVKNTPSGPDGKTQSYLLRPLAAGLAFSSAGALSAAIVHNDTPVNGSHTFAVDPGDDFQFQVNPGIAPNPWKFPSGFGSSISLTPINGALLTSSALAFGAEVGESSSFTSNTASDYIGGTHYYGFSLTGGTTLYGWMSLTHNYGTGNGTGSVNAWAYDTTGAAIMVGQTTAIPEPSSAAVAAALIAGSAAMLRRRSRKLVALAA